MGIAEAIVIAAVVGGTTAAVQSNQAKKAAAGQQKALQTQRAQNAVQKKITKRDTARKGARSALVAGSSNAAGVLTTTATTGRGNLLGN